MKRDNLYERLNGLPKFTRQELASKEQKYTQSVDHKDFLPNSLLSKITKSTDRSLKKSSLYDSRNGKALTN